MALAFGSTARLAQDGDNLNDSVLPPGVDELILERTIGFEGDVPNGFVVHPDEALLYPLGSTLMVRSLASPGVQHFLQGSISKITAVAVSASGRYVATGHAAETAAFKADICVWDWEARERVCKFVLHKGQVQDLAFSAEERFLVSLGGEDDNTLVVWDVEEGKAVCGAPASKASEGYAKTVTFLNGDPMTFISGGDQTLRLWTLDLNIRKILAEDCVLGTLKRVITCIAVDAGDEGAYCGTTTGDVLYVALATRLFRFSGPQKRRDMFSRGVTSICLAGGDVVVGAGDGTLGMLDASNLLPLKLLDLQGSVTSIARDSPRGDYLYVGTLTSNIYYVETSSFEAELRSTCHPGKVNDVCFPPGYSEVIATCGPNDIRLWNVARSDELLRIAVPNLECLCVVFSHDGGALLSGWDDGKVRAFGPESGKLLFQIDNAHKGGVTALAVTKNGEKLVSGGQDGSVRVWRLGPESQSLEITMKEHRGAVSSLHMSADDLECVSSSADGSCILWDLEQWVRVQVMFAPSYFRAVKLHPEEGQAVSCGDDRILAFWDVYDGTAIRELEQSHPVNSVDVFADGERFVSGGASKIVTLWDYDDGEVTHVGKGHGGNIIKVVVAPDQREIVSISDEGAIFFWRVPDEEEPLDV